MNWGKMTEGCGKVLESVGVALGGLAARAHDVLSENAVEKKFFSSKKGRGSSELSGGVTGKFGPGSKNSEGIGGARHSGRPRD